MDFLYKTYRCLMENGWWYTRRKILASLFGAADPWDDPRWPKKREEFFQRHPERRPKPSVAWLKSRGKPAEGSPEAGSMYALFCHDLSTDYQIYYPAENQWNTDKKARNLLFVTHELSLTGAPVVLLEAVRLAARRGDFCVVISPMDGLLKEKFLKLGAVVMVQNGRDTFEQFAQDFDCAIINTLACSWAVRLLSGTPIAVLWWIHEGSFAVDALKEGVPGEIAQNIHPFCVSEYSRTQLEKAGFDYHPGILRIGLEDKAAKYSPCPPRGDKTAFLTVGAVEARKGQDILLKAIECLPKAVSDKAEFYIVGSVYDTGLEAVILEACAEHGNIHFLPGIPREELMRLYSQIDCVLIPSRDDPLPTVGIEAAMFSKLPISSDCAGFAPAAAQYAGIPVFPSEDYKALAAQIEKVINNPAQAYTEGKKLRRFYEELYSTESFEKAFVPLVDSLSQKSHRLRFGKTRLPAILRQSYNLRTKEE